MWLWLSMILTLEAPNEWWELPGSRTPLPTQPSCPLPPQLQPSTSLLCPLDSWLGLSCHSLPLRPGTPTPGDPWGLESNLLPTSPLWSASDSLGLWQGARMGRDFPVVLFTAVEGNFTAHICLRELLPLSISSNLEAGESSHRPLDRHRGKP